MDEAEQLCDRLVVMDSGLIVAEGSPLELIRRLLDPRGRRAAVRRRRARRPRRQGRGPRRAGRGAAGPAAALHRRRRGDPGARCTSAGSRRPSVAGAPLHAGGRLPAPHRPDAGRLMTTTDPTSTGPTTSVSTAPTAPASRWAGAARMTDYWATVYRRTWKGSVVNSFVRRCSTSLAMGVLLGGLRSRATRRSSEGATSYLAFVAPGLLAAQAMTTVFGEVTYPVMAMIKWQHIFYAMVATPLRSPTSSWPSSASCCSASATICGVFTLGDGAVRRRSSRWWASCSRSRSQLLVGARVRGPDLRGHRRDAGRERLRLIFRLGHDPDVPVLRRVLPDHQPRPGAWSGWPG